MSISGLRRDWLIARMDWEMAQERSVAAAEELQEALQKALEAQGDEGMERQKQSDLHRAYLAAQEEECK